MPINKKDYHPNWANISIQVRDEAGHKCEWCGVPNRMIIERLDKPSTATGMDWVEVIVCRNPTDNKPEETAELTANQLRLRGLRKIVITVAHLDRNSENNDRSNLAALCQRCHF